LRDQGTSPTARCTYLTFFTKGQDPLGRFLSKGDRGWAGTLAFHNNRILRGVCLAASPPNPFYAFGAKLGAKKQGVAPLVCAHGSGKPRATVGRSYRVYETVDSPTTIDQRGTSMVTVF